VYVGSTTQSLAKRYGEHKTPSNTTSSRRVIDVGDSYIELIENYPCGSKEELNRREGEIMRTMECINIQIAGRSNKQYRENNKEKITEKMKEYRENNKEKIAYLKQQYRENNKEKITEQRKEYRENNKEKIAYLKQQYRENNKEKLSEKRKDYRENNKDRNTQYYESRKDNRMCVCGSTYDHQSPSIIVRHEKTKKHLKYSG
jgi:exonuclease VII large subunit